MLCFFQMDEYSDETLEERVNEYIEKLKEEQGKLIEIISITYGQGKHMPGLYVAFKVIEKNFGIKAGLL